MPAGRSTRLFLRGFLRNPSSPHFTEPLGARLKLATAKSSKKHGPMGCLIRFWSSRTLAKGLSQLGLGKTPNVGKRDQTAGLQGHDQVIRCLAQQHRSDVGRPGELPGCDQLAVLFPIVSLSIRNLQSEGRGRNVAHLARRERRPPKSSGTRLSNSFNPGSESRAHWGRIDWPPFGAEGPSTSSLPSSFLRWRSDLAEIMGRRCPRPPSCQRCLASTLAFGSDGKHPRPGRSGCGSTRNTCKSLIRSKRIARRTLAEVLWGVGETVQP